VKANLPSSAGISRYGILPFYLMSELTSLGYLSVFETKTEREAPESSQYENARVHGEPYPFVEITAVLVYLSVNSKRVSSPGKSCNLFTLRKVLILLVIEDIST